MNALLAQALSGQNPAAACTAKCILLAVLYIVFGELGLMLAVPPGYATVIWPASGIATGMLLVHGRGLWPGVFLGSLLLNTHISSAVTPESADMAKLAAAAGIAAGSTLQALAGRWLGARFIGMPLAFTSLREVMALFLLAGPFACLIAASLGVASLTLAGIMPGDLAAKNWLTWWMGDTFGVFVFLPLVLLAPGGKEAMTWRGDRVGSLPLLAMVALLVPLGLTFYAWKVTSENVYQESVARFNTLAQESEKALRHRLDSYNYALLGGIGFFQGSEFVSAGEWSEYVNAVDVTRNFPGINGIGYIEAVAQDERAAFIERTRRDDRPGFDVHPETTGRPLYVIKYIEPESANAAAVGLNIGFEDNRQAAAERARDTGKPVVTRRIILVQDAEKTPGFLLLHPMYRTSLPANTAEERRRAFTGWIYAAFIGRNFFKGLTDSQGDTLHIRVYDGDAADEDALIFSDERAETRATRKTSAFSVQKKITVMQSDWTILWESTTAFETRNHSDSPVFILAGGLLFTGLFGLFLVLATLRAGDALEIAADRHVFIFPAAVFAATMGGVLYLYTTLTQNEAEYARAAAREAAVRVEKIIALQAEDRFRSLRRMASRWENEGGRSERLWRADAAMIINDLSGVTTLEWIGPDYRIRYAEPVKGNESALGLDILFDPQRAEALKGAAAKDSITLTPPLDLVQGYRGVIAYAPINMDGVFGGFMAGILSVDGFFGGIIESEIPSGYRTTLSHEGKAFLVRGAEVSELLPALGVTRTITLHDKSFKLGITPTKALVREIKTDIPNIVLFFGTLVAALLALTVRYVLISRVKSGRLEESNKLNEGILFGATHFILVTDTKGNVLVLNRMAEEMLGYTAEEVIGTHNPSIWHDDAEVEKRAQELTESEGRVIFPGLKVFTLMAEKNGSETRDWTIIRKDGSTFPMRLTVTTLRDKKGDATGYLGIGEDITEMNEMDRMKSEFISIVSHELRTPLTSIRGSLGLIEGAMSAEIPEKARNLVNIAHKNSERLILLINDILDLDKITAGKMSFNLETHDTAALVNAGAEVNEAYAAKNNVTVSIADMPAGMMVSVDADRWQQVFTNLLSNAVKFSPEGSEVRVAAERRGRRIRVSVTDNGPGISEEFRDRIFGKFSQADSPLRRQKGGTGLGLNICREIVTRMNGEIGFDSTPGAGATFWFEFPDVTPSSGGKGLGMPPPVVEGGRPVILYLEDDTDLSRLLEAALADHADVIQARTLSDARAALSVLDFDLVVLDIVLPDGSGLDLLEDLDRQKRRAPVVILSSTETPPGLNPRAVAALVKSRVSEGEIIDTIVSHLPNPEKKKNED